jgi:Mn2+/Fe2+ NRAMP family transporter
MNGVVIANEVKLYHGIAVSLRICNDCFIGPFAIDLALSFVSFNAVEMLFYSTVLNGVLAPPLIVLAVLLTSKSERLKRRGKVSEYHREKGNR